MVVTALPATALIGVEQLRTASPSRCTVQAPHWAMPQPYLVPVSPMTSRTTQSSGISGGTSTDWGWPLRVKLIAMRGSAGERGTADDFGTRGDGDIPAGLNLRPADSRREPGPLAGRRHPRIHESGGGR